LKSSVSQLMWTVRFSLFPQCAQGTTHENATQQFPWSVQKIALQWVHFNRCVGQSMVGMPFNMFLVPCIYCSIGKSTYCSIGKACKKRFKLNWLYLLKIVL